MLHQCRVDLTELDAESAHLDLEVGSADEFDVHCARVGEHGVGSERPPHDVTGPVHPGSRSTVWIGHEARRSQILACVIATRQRSTGEIELTRGTDRHRIETVVENERGHSVDRASDRDRHTWS